MKVLLLYVCVALCAASLPTDWHAYEKYRGYVVLNVTPINDDQARQLREWMLTDNQLDFWQEASHGEAAHIMVSPKYLPTFQVQLRKQQFHYSVLHDNVEQQMDKFMGHTMRRMAQKLVFDINDFNTYDDIIDWVRNDVPSMCSGGLSCTTQDEGTTHENRDIVSLTMSTGGAGKQTFLINSLIHAREWLAGATVSKIIDHIANNYGSDNEVTGLLDSYDFVFIPVMNPDGYDYTWTDERLWRKNRSPQGACIGVDLNRNYDHMWGEEGVSHNSCSDQYCGPSGNSELETQIMDGIMRSLANGGGVIGYLDVHAYGQMWMHPWGNTVNHAGQVCERADDHDDMYYVADRAADAIEATHNTRWARGTSCEVIYETTGATDDYIKAVHGVKYPICPELRGNSFVVAPEEIQPSFEEIWNGIVEMVAAIEETGGS